MLNLERPTSYYFDLCQQIIWYRLTYDKLYILYNNCSKSEISSLWRRAIALSIDFNENSAFTSRMFSINNVLETALKGNDEEWNKLLRIVEARIDMRRLIDDYFLGVSCLVIRESLEAGEYDVR